MHALVSSRLQTAELMPALVREFMHALVISRLQTAELMPALVCEFMHALASPQHALLSSLVHTDEPTSNELGSGNLALRLIESAARLGAYTTAEQRHRTCWSMAYIAPHAEAPTHAHALLHRSLVQPSGSSISTARPTAQLIRKDLSSQTTPTPLAWCRATSPRRQC
jgi:hypothetical protein